MKINSETNKGKTCFII